MSSFQSRKLLNSLVGQRRTNVPLIGDKNNVNLVFETPDEFIPGTEEIVLEGIDLNGDTTDPNKDYSVTTTGAKANREITLIVDTNVKNQIHSPPKQKESLLANYQRRITC